MIWTFSPSNTPPPGMGPLWLTPKSIRLISPVAVNPARVPTAGPGAKGSAPKPLISSFSGTGRVVPAVGAH